MKIEVVTRFNADLIEVSEYHTYDLDDLRQRVTTQIIKLKDKQVREALIALGWTPPPEKP